MLTSLIALKAMTSEQTGAVIAAPTTSLPEELGGVRNWDYRYCRLRDSVLAPEALLDAGYTEESVAFRDFLLRVGTGDPAAIQIMYGVGGERRLSEFEMPHLPGYEGSRPVRIGNAASEQFQLDVYGEVAAVMSIGAERLGRVEPRLWPRWRAIVEYVETIWRRPDDGSGRRGGRSGTTRTPRSWPGSCSTAPCGLPSGSGWRPSGALGRGAGRDPRGGVQARLRPRAPHVHAVLQGLAGELDRAGYTAAAKCLADELDALVVHLRYPTRHRRRWRSTNLLERSLGEVIGACRRAP